MDEQQSDTGLPVHVIRKSPELLELIGDAIILMAFITREARDASFGASQLTLI
jgi:hypothetical protein